jgi:flagellar biogenesis protein FliO
VTDRHLALAKLLVQMVLALTLIIAMTWIVLAPVSDEATKGALVIVGTAVGFLFGRETRA